MARGIRKGSILMALFTVVFGASFLVSPAGADAPPPPTPDPFYGTWSDGLSPTPEVARSDMDRQAAAGVGLRRQYVFWDRIETSPGVFDWSRMDQLITDATARRIKILPTLLYTPSFYSSKPAGSTSNAQFPPSDPETMARFAEAMVHRYGPNGTYWCTPLPPPLPPSCNTPYVPITAWEIWNEPDFPSWWKGVPNPDEFAPLLRAVSAGIKRADPSAEVVNSSLTNLGASGDGKFLDRLYSLGAAAWFDTISINPYATSAAAAVAYVRGARAISMKHGDGQTPIRVTEYGWASGGYSPKYQTTEACQAALLHSVTQRFAALRTELNIKSIIQFQWHDLPNPGTPWPNWAGVIRGDDSAKPSLGALTEAIAGRPPPSGLTLAEACPEDRRAVDQPTRGSVVDDPFTRTMANGWGAADTGGAYTHGTGTDPSFSVTDGLGRMEVPAPGGNRLAVLGSTSARNVDMRVSVSSDKVATDATGQVVTLFTRRVATNSEYRMRARLSSDRKVRLSIVKVVGGTMTTLGTEVEVTGLTHKPGAFIVLRLQVTGASPTTMSAKAWAIGEAEPNAWALTRTDSESALQAGGALGLGADLSVPSANAPVVFSFDDLQVTAPK